MPLCSDIPAFRLYATVFEYFNIIANIIFHKSTEYKYNLLRNSSTRSAHKPVLFGTWLAFVNDINVKQLAAPLLAEHACSHFRFVAFTVLPTRIGLSTFLSLQQEKLQSQNNTYVIKIRHNFAGHGGGTVLSRSLGSRDRGFESHSGMDVQCFVYELITRPKCPTEYLRSSKPK
jgi:hypothetical protein